MFADLLDGGFRFGGCFVKRFVLCFEIEILTDELKNVVSHCCLVYQFIIISLSLKLDIIIIIIPIEGSLLRNDKVIGKRPLPY